MHRIGIIGAGSFGAAHARAIGAVSGAQVVAASRTNADALHSFCAEFGGREYPDYRDLLGDNDVDAVVIATPHHMHREMAIDAAQAGKHVLLEKPFAATLEECDEISMGAASANVTLMVGHTRRFQQASLVAKELIDAGKIGDVIMGVATMTKLWKIAERQPWHLQEDSGGGVLLTLGVHDIDLLCYLLDSRVHSVRAKLGNRIHNDDVDDTGMIFLDFENGSSASIVNAGYRHGVQQMDLKLIGSAGMLRASGSEGVFIGNNERWSAVPDSTGSGFMQDALVNEWQEFLSAIDERREPTVSIRQARHAMEVGLAAVESSRLGTEIVLEVRPQ
jgi:phthalate 4,5-cis-dihydrodiol dehydrogenase